MMSGFHQMYFILCQVTLIYALADFKSYNREEGYVISNNGTKIEEDFHVNETSVHAANSAVEETRKYGATWDSLDSRPLPSWYDQAKIGIFVHWGVFSVPAVRTEWFWNVWKRGNHNECEQYVLKNYKPNFTYQEFAPDFTAEFYDPVQWAQLFSKAGAKYVVLTSKHHEGYTLWPSKYSWSWNSMDVGPHRDLVGDLATAIRNQTGMVFGLYHSLYEWYNPLWRLDVENNFSTSHFVDFKIEPSLHEIVEKYLPEIIWSDGEWEASSTYWRSKEFLAWLYNESSVKDTVVTNDRWGGDTLCRHGGYYTCADGYNPGVLQRHKWENCYPLDTSWGYRKNAKIGDFKSPEVLMSTIASTVSCGGNVLVNVGPTKEGVIPPVQQERLLQMGEWLSVNGLAIYNSVPWKHQNDTRTPGIWYTCNKNESNVYALLTSWPKGSVLLGSIEEDTYGEKNITASMLGYDQGDLEWYWEPGNSNAGMMVTLPTIDQVKSKWVWTLVVKGLEMENAE